MAPKPIPAQLMAQIEEERTLLQATGYTGKVVIEFDVRLGLERCIKITTVRIAKLALTSHE
jgi:hypothetical protein